MFGPHFHMHNCMTNPFGMGFTAMNPKINFCLGMAAATSGMYSSLPVFSGSLFSAYPSFNTFPSTFGTFSSPALFNNNFGTFNLNNSMSYLNSGMFSTPIIAASSFNPSVSYAASALNYTPAFSIPTLNIDLTKPIAEQMPQLNLQSNSAVDNSNPTGSKKSLNSDDYGPKFLEKVKQIAQRLNCNYRDLLGVMNSESGINAGAKSSSGSASGLIQFLESTAKSLGTTTAALRAMKPIDQLDYVEKCIANSKKMAGFADGDKLSAGDLYALVFLPARAKNNTLTQSGESYYGANAGLDKNKDGKITKDELSARVKSFYVSDDSFLA